MPNQVSGSLSLSQAFCVADPIQSVFQAWGGKVGPSALAFLSYSRWQQHPDSGAASSSLQEP